MRIALLVLALLLGLTDGATAAWQRPVPGARRGRSPTHRRRRSARARTAAWICAPSRANVRAACRRRARRRGRGVGGGRARARAWHVVTLRCGALARDRAAAGVARRARGRARARGREARPRRHAAGHTGLHVGVRRASDRFAYVDPLPLLRGETRRRPRGPASGAARGAARRAAAPRRVAPAATPLRRGPARRLPRAASRHAARGRGSSPARVGSRLGPPGSGSLCWRSGRSAAACGCGCGGLARGPAVAVPSPP